MKEKPLILRLYQEPARYETARAIGYEGVPASEIRERVKPLEGRLGQAKVEAALLLLTTYQVPGADRVRLREHVRKIRFQLLGPPPEHPEFEHFKSPDPWVPSWARVPEPTPAKPKGTKKRARNKQE